jgi:hypothetical protein
MPDISNWHNKATLLLIQYALENSPQNKSISNIKLSFNPVVPDTSPDLLEVL